VTVDGFCFKNGHSSLAVASREFTKGSVPVTKEIIYPAQFSTPINEKLLKVHSSVVEALGFTFGHTHGEYLLTKENDIYLVECTNRGGGVYTSSVILPLLTNIDLNKIFLEKCLGKDDYELPDEHSYMKKSAILTFLDLEVGKVVKSSNFSQVSELPSTVRFRSIYQEKDMVESIENCASRHTMAVVKGNDVSDAIHNLNNLKKTLSVSYY
jgi:hypothetical protein